MTVLADVDRLSERESKILLAHFIYHMSQADRRNLAAQYPEFYNKLCGTDVAKVSLGND